MLKKLLKKAYLLKNLTVRPTHTILKFILIPTLLVLITFSFLFFLILKDLPSPKDLKTKHQALTTHIKDRNGNTLYKIHGNQNRTLVNLNDLPPHLVNAIIAIEDHDFYKHNGFSPRAVLRSALSNYQCQQTNINCNVEVQGGSTITQQLVKVSLLTPERTIERKVKELILSIAVEALYSKKQILEMYLNTVSFGGQAYGIQEAAQSYFGVDAKDLDLSQSSLLAGLPASPTTYSPFGNKPQLAKSRQKEVLRRMVQLGYITTHEASEASEKELRFVPPDINIKAPHFVMYVKEFLSRKYGPQAVEQGGLEVTTTLDINLQEFAQKTVFEEVSKVKNLRISNGSLLSIDPRNGQILAMVGSTNYFDIKKDGNVNVTLSLRQPGSSIKPLNYALAFENGFSPASLIDDSPITYKVPGQPDYSPVNYDNKFHGKVSLRQALASSYNIPAVKLLSANGIQNFILFSQKLGITSFSDTNRFGLSLTLGGGEVSMLELTSAYAVFANQGTKVDINPILNIKDSRGKTIEDNQCQSSDCNGKQVISKDIAFLISDILSDNQARTPTFGPRSNLYIPSHKVAVKTGTTNNLRDNWTVGYTPSFVTAVWVGNNDNTPMSYVASGVTGASPIWRKVMDFYLKDQPPFKFEIPSTLELVSICPLTGQRSCSNCQGKPDYFTKSNIPTSYCNPEQITKILEKTPSPTPTGYKILEGISTER